MAALSRVMAQPQGDGTLDYSASYCGRWPGAVVEAVVRLTAAKG